MQLGAVTYNVLKDMDLETVITTLEKTGFEGVELRTGHKHGVEPSLSAEERQKVKARFERTRVKLYSFGTTCEFQSADEAERKKQIDMAKQFVQLAHDTGAIAIKVRPNGFAKGVPKETTIANIGAGLREVGQYGYVHGVEVWLEVHGAETQNPPVAAEIMRATKHDNVGLCWNSNPTDIVDGSVKQNFELLRPWLRSCHINELASSYPYRELFALMRRSGYDRWTLCEAGESKEPERFLRYYRALWMEMQRA
jgi:sugar phosphate isomerase/epimerase